MAAAARHCACRAPAAAAVPRCAALPRAATTWPRPVVPPAAAATLRARPLALRRRAATRCAAAGDAPDPAQARPPHRIALLHLGAPLTAEERFCLAEFGPWVKDADGARRCLAFLRDREKRVFDLGKARDVMASLKEEHAKRYPPFLEEPVPFDLPKTWPGMQLVLQRCSNPIE